MNIMKNTSLNFWILEEILFFEGFLRSISYCIDSINELRSIKLRDNAFFSDIFYDRTKRYSLFESGTSLMIRKTMEPFFSGSPEVFCFAAFFVVLFYRRRKSFLCRLSCQWTIIGKIITKS